jgi:signal transduction histidine kinase
VRTTRGAPRRAAVLTRLVVLGTLAAFIGVVYLVLPVGLGTLLGTGPNTALSIAATGVVALGFARVREWAQRTAQRLVYGSHSTPYEVLTELSDRMAGSYATTDVLLELAQILVLGSGAATARVWLRVGDELVTGAAWPESSSLVLPPAVLSSSELPWLPEADHAIAIRHHGHLIGAITVTELPSAPLSAADLRLLYDFASQAGLALRNVRLTAELASSLEAISAQATEIRASRRRIVDAQDAERRRVERDIHDGAQQYLVALMVQLRVARRLATKDPPRAEAIVEDLQGVVHEALDTLSDLAQGIHPPLLTEQGLAAALRRQEGNPALTVTVEERGLVRYTIELEAAVYFACLEALNNAAKHAPGSNVAVQLFERDGHLVFSVRDDGAGFDSQESRPGSGLGNMVDRVAALGGTLHITSVPNRGTTVAGRVPLGKPVEDAA